MIQAEQNPGEPVADTCKKFITGLTRNLWFILVSLNANEKEQWKKRISAEALECFLFGLRNPPEYRVASKLQNSSPKKECIFCKSNNHDVSQCKELFKSVEQGKIKHTTVTQEADTAITTITPVFENIP